jgi:hypothetical protein
MVGAALCPESAFSIGIYDPAMAEVRRAGAWIRLRLVLGCGALACGTVLAAAPAALAGYGPASRAVAVVGHLPSAATHALAPVARAGIASAGLTKHRLGKQRPGEWSAGAVLAAALLATLAATAVVRRRGRVVASPLASSHAARAPPSTVSD